MRDSVIAICELTASSALPIVIRELTCNACPSSVQDLYTSIVEVLLFFSCRRSKLADECLFVIDPLRIVVFTFVCKSGD